MADTWNYSPLATSPNDDLGFNPQSIITRARPCSRCCMVRRLDRPHQVWSPETDHSDNVSPSRLSFNLHLIVPSMMVTFPSNIDDLPP